MDASRRTSTLRRIATTASLAALLLIPAGQAEAAKKKPKYPVITSVSPMTAAVGQTLLLKGRNFRKGKTRNAVGFKRKGAAVVFVKSDLSTTRTLTVKLSKKLDKVVGGQTAKFRLRVLAAKFGKSYTSKRRSPTISGTPGVIPPVDPTVIAPDGDCDEDGVINRDDADDDNDLLDDKLEEKLGTGSCDADSDDDLAEDGYEYKSAIDLNDDEYQRPNTVHPYPGKRPYPNPLFKDDTTDFDGDGLRNGQEHALWRYTITELGKPATLFPLTYSDGLQYSIYGVTADGRRVPALSAEAYDRFFGAGTGPQPACDDPDNANKNSEGFKPWLERCGYATVLLHDSGAWTRFDDGSPFSEGLHDYSIFDADRSGTVEPGEAFSMDRDGNGSLSDDERDEDADGLPNHVESNGEISRPEWWTSCYVDEGVFPVAYAGTLSMDTDSDGDGIRDGADDQDHDDVPNIMELSRKAASHAFDGKAHCEKPDPPEPAPTPVPDPDAVPTTTPAPTPTPDPKLVHETAYGQVNPFNPCLPDRRSRTCPRYQEFDDEGYAPFNDAENWLSLN